ncbi:hypothetical protein K402DRAFT_424728 [Aulographum hederae CBS 113979]|uniref:Centromere protein H C-terminal domain-containing protein n=1 Tax=Aulographum hederae CBS 113979 TaxID=1176131 RepID=A0A6G1GN95_9PEZI|nr:hypothetical protein K402DRAFT_424728 [Aulographum hederae CBS 113979]
MDAASSGGPAKSNYDTLLETPNSDQLQLSRIEEEILALWDQADELALEQSLIHAQRSADPQDVDDLSDEELKAELAVAENDVLEARAGYILRNKIIHNVLVTDPVLKAVHGAQRSTHAEKRLLPLINERDVLAMVQSTLSKEVLSTKMKLAAAQKENMMKTRENQKTAQTLLGLTDELNARKNAEVDDPMLRTQLEAADSAIRESKRLWRITKSIVAGTVVGSGINWAQDEDLLRLVLDDEDDMG